jgi:hypothetical protein
MDVYVIGGTMAYATPANVEIIIEDYSENRSWSDKYKSEVKQILNNYYQSPQFISAQRSRQLSMRDGTLQEDYKGGDIHTEVKLSFNDGYRIRNKDKCKKNYLGLGMDFYGNYLETMIRGHVPRHTTEIDHMLNGFVNHNAYCFADKNICNHRIENHRIEYVDVFRECIEYKKSQGLTLKRILQPLIKDQANLGYGYYKTSILPIENYALRHGKRYVVDYDKEGMLLIDKARDVMDLANQFEENLSDPLTYNYYLCASNIFHMVKESRPEYKWLTFEWVQFVVKQKDQSDCHSMTDTCNYVRMCDHCKGEVAIRLRISKDDPELDGLGVGWPETVEVLEGNDRGMEQDYYTIDNFCSGTCVHLQGEFRHMMAKD